MNNRLIDLIMAYRTRDGSRAGQSLWVYAAEKDPHVFSHHPMSPVFREHVWKIGGLYFCKGCVTTLCGIVFGVGFFVATGWLRFYTDARIGMIFILLFMPTVTVHFFRFPRWFRLVSRFLLGFLIASSLLMLFVTNSWLIRAIIVAVYLLAKVAMMNKRRRENEEKVVRERK